MYHYVREGEADLPNFRYLHVSDFRRQLDYLGREFGFLPRETFLALLAGDPVEDDRVILTFDDGLLDHRQYVLPELQKRGLWGLFYIPTGVHRDSTPLSVHQVHFLLGRYSAHDIFQALCALVRPEMLPFDRVEDYHRLTYRLQTDADQFTTAVKRILNYLIADEWRRPVLERLTSEFPIFPDAFGRCYMDLEGLRGLHQAGMILGSHGVSHRVMSQLTIDQQRREIQDSFAFLDEVAPDLELRSFCYPYGGSHTFTSDTEQLLRDAGCRVAFSVEHRDVRRADLRDRPLALPRFDCQAFPHGRASCGLRQAA